VGGVRTLVEWALSFNRHLSILFCFLIFVYFTPFLVPFAFSRIAGDADWYVPAWSKVKLVVAQRNRRMVKYMFVTTIGYALFYATVLFDQLVFISDVVVPNKPVWLVTASRPICILVLKRLSNYIVNRSATFNPSPGGKVLQFQASQFFYASVGVKLCTGSSDATALVVNVLVDWFVFGVRVWTYWFATSPHMKKPSPLLKVQIFDKIPPAFAPPHMHRAELRGFEFIMESMCMTMAYMSTIAGYWVMRATGIGPGNAVFNFYFPHGETSLHYCLVGMVNDLLQDASAHRIVSAGSRRHHVAGERSWQFTRINPGMLNSLTDYWFALTTVLPCIAGSIVFMLFAFAFQEMGWML